MIEAEARTLNEKLENVVKSGKIFNAGFNQTGHFSIGYTIYTREADYVCPSCGAALGRFPSQNPRPTPI